MDKKWFFILLIICTFTHLVRFVYEILKHKNVVKANKITFAIIFPNMLLLWVSWFLLCYFDIFKIDINIIIRYLGLSFCIAGVICFLTALATIKTLESYEGELITTGIYSIIRHPMYLGFILWTAGFPIYCGAVFSFILAVPFILNILFWKHLEEKELEKRFASYKDYRKTTFF
jgi:protein-S-isoprenylcysteine O-methyltransferase Ste14